MIAKNYFDINGERYYTGTVIVIKIMGKPTEAIFIGCHKKLNKYVYQVGNGKYFVDERTFYKQLVNVTSQVNNIVQLPALKTKKDRNIDGMFLGWLWYIFLMTISFIFKDALGLWIIISIVFFSWRAKKIKEEGNYIEW